MSYLKRVFESDILIDIIKTMPTEFSWTLCANSQIQKALYKEITYRNIMYVSGLFLIIGFFVNFSNPKVDAISYLVFSVVAVNTVLFAYLWLRNILLLIGYLLYLISFNFDLLTNSLFNDFVQQETMDSLSFLFQLDLLATGIVLIGIFADKHFKSKTQFGVSTLLIITIAGTAVFQAAIRFL